MNVELLTKIKHRILREPKKFSMDAWDCGTAMCIGGWACALSSQRLPHDFSIERRANKLLRLGKTDYFGETPMGRRLFYLSSWPSALETAFRKARTRKQRATIAAKRIDQFIETKGKE